METQKEYQHNHQYQPRNLSCGDELMETLMALYQCQLDSNSQSLLWR